MPRQARMTPLESWYAPIRHLSLDVAAGSAVTSRFLLQSQGIRLPWSQYGLLALAVWLIYAGDHLLDSYRLRHLHAALPGRHAFFKRQRPILWPLWILGVVLLAWGLWAMRFPLWPNVVIAGLPMLAYLLLDKAIRLRTPMLKSCSIASGFTLGLVVFKLDDMRFLMQAWPTLLAVFFLAIHNIWIFERYEADYDHRVLRETVDTHGVSHRLRHHPLLRQTPLMGMMLALIAGGASISQAGMLGLMGLVLLACDVFPRWFNLHERYRVFGDGVFLLPALMLLK